MSATLRIEFMDGTGTVVDRVDKTKVVEGVLCAYGRSWDLVSARILGAWPLVDIKSWKWEER